MKTITLNTRWSTAKKGFVALVDDDDIERVSKYNWTIAKRGIHIYAKTHINRKMIYMHRFILSPKSKYIIDHINCDGLDNRKENLRLCSYSQNRCNRGKTIENSSGFKGVYRADTKEIRWYTRISKNYKNYYIGIFKTKKQAAIAYNEAAIKHHGEFAKLNKIEDLKSTESRKQ